MWRAIQGFYRFLVDIRRVYLPNIQHPLYKVWISLIVAVLIFQALAVWYSFLIWIALLILVSWIVLSLSLHRIIDMHPMLQKAEELQKKIDNLTKTGSDKD